jgi:hypothetical protein
VRSKLRAGDEHYDWLTSNHARAFYANYKADPEHLERGFLKSALLVKVRDLNCNYFVFTFTFFLARLLKVYKSIFTSPSSAADVADDYGSERENEPPLKATKLSQSRKKATKRNVASKLHMNDKVTPRSIAYATVLVLFDLMQFCLEYLLTFIPIPASLQFADR